MAVQYEFLIIGDGATHLLRRMTPLNASLVKPLNGGEWPDPIPDGAIILLDGVFVSRGSAYDIVDGRLVFNCWLSADPPTASRVGIIWDDTQQLRERVQELEERLAALEKWKDDRN